MKPILLFLLLVAVLIAGCAPAPQRMSETDRKATRIASIDRNVEKPPAPFYLGPGGAVGLMFGAIGAIATEPGREEGRNSLLDFLAKNGVSVERIVLEEFGAALRASGKIALAEKAGPGEAVIRISIKQYGLSIPNGFSSKLVPIMSLAAEMTDASGKLIWSANDRILTLGNPVEGVPGDEMRNDPKAIEAAWRAAAKHISANIIKEL